MTNFSCEYCKKSFGKKYTLKRHIYVVHFRLSWKDQQFDKSKKQFSCPTCFKLYSHNRSLQRHERKFHGAKFKRLTQSEKLLLRDLLFNGMTLDQVLEDIKDPSYGFSLDRICLVSKKALRNIAREFQLELQKNGNEQQIAIKTEDLFNDDDGKDLKTRLVEELTAVIHHVQHLSQHQAIVFNGIFDKFLEKVMEY